MQPLRSESTLPDRAPAELDAFLAQAARRTEHEAGRGPLAQQADLFHGGGPRPGRARAAAAARMGRLGRGSGAALELLDRVGRQIARPQGADRFGHRELEGRLRPSDPPLDEDVVRDGDASIAYFPGEEP